MLDDQPELRRLVEPAALEKATPHLAQAGLAAMIVRLDAAAAEGPTIAPEVMEALAADLHDTCLSPQPNCRLAEATRALQAARVVNRLFATHEELHDESALVAEHRLVSPPRRGLRHGDDVPVPCAVPASERDRQRGLQPEDEAGRRGSSGAKRRAGCWNWLT